MTQQRGLFSGAVFLASFLLFLVEPMAAKQLLPSLGGSAAVWITCLVFFQTALLAAYLYAHWLAHRMHPALHSVLLVLAAASAIVWAVLPFQLTNASVHPIWAIFTTLSISIGLPFLALGATSPLLQVWLARMEVGPVPYRLYALSNLASLLALASYPTLIEPQLTLRMQRIIWCCGFAVFAAISALLAARTSVVNAATDIEHLPDVDAPTSSLQTKLLWLLLPMAAAIQLSAVTGYLTQNIAAIPLLWILPLGAYLITLIIAFQFPGLLPRGILARLLVVMLAALGYMLSKVEVSLPLGIGLAFFLLELFIACLFLHSEACALRPRRTSESTLFYLLFAAGGALGSFLVGIVAPVALRFNYDIALSFFITALASLAVLWSSGWPQRLLWTTASVLLFVLVIMIHIASVRSTPFASRNFYGALRVRESLATHPGALTRTLTNGTIQHGTQIYSDALRKTPTTYYAEDSGVGLALRFCCEARSRNIGVIGLGVGTIAAYGHTGDRITFYEINPAVVPIARNVFSYMRESGAEIRIVEGDARTSLAHEPPQNFDVLVIDAFTGDAIPLHLLTAEAVDLYKRQLAPGGVLAFHISNQHVDLDGQIALLAQHAGMTARRVSSLEDKSRGEFTATWMLVTNNASFLAQPEIERASHEPTNDARVRLWTDNYSSLLPLLHW